MIRDLTPNAVDVSHGEFAGLAGPAGSEHEDLEGEYRSTYGSERRTSTSAAPVRLCPAGATLHGVTTGLKYPTYAEVIIPS